MTRTSHRAGATASALSAALLLAACSSSSNNSPGASGGSASAADSRDATITITADKGCTLDRTTFNAGALNVKVNNVDAAAVSEVEVRATGERILGEVENVPPSISGTFSLDLAAGQYTMYCPGAKTERSTFTVSGTAPSAGDTDVHVLLDSGTKTYGQYVTNEVGNLVSSVTALNKALAGTDLTAAQAAYIKARPYYERIEPVAESFKDPKDLDAAIDETPRRRPDSAADHWFPPNRIRPVHGEEFGRPGSDRKPVARGLHGAAETHQRLGLQAGRIGQRSGRSAERSGHKQDHW